MRLYLHGERSHSHRGWLWLHCTHRPSGCSKASPKCNKACRDSRNAPGHWGYGENRHCSLCMSFNRETALHSAVACSDAVKVSQDASSAWAWRNDLGLVCLNLFAFLGYYAGRGVFQHVFRTDPVRCRPRFSIGKKYRNLGPIMSLR